MLAIIQARTNSKRFPKKALYKINSIPLIIRVLDNVSKSKLVTKAIIATSKEKSDDILINLVKKFKYKFFRGSLNNVALRMLQAAKNNNAKYFIRINGDSPLIDYRIIDYAIETMKKNKNADLITNVFPRVYPSGLSVEIIKTKILKDNILNFNLYEKEHVTSYFYSNSKHFKIINFKKNINNYKYLPKLSVDYKSDLKKIMKYFND
jgi:spore coat polysaccharide biosynthesis protein SpsF (cytidylyltransferase family)